jgi:membrane-associated phospholipid phosphatase
VLAAALLAIRLSTKPAADPLAPLPSVDVRVDVDALAPALTPTIDAAEPPPQNSAAEDESDRKKPPTPPHTGIRALGEGLLLDIKNLPSLPNLYTALGGGAAALAVHPFDSTFNVRLESHYDVINDFFAPAKYYGNTPEQIALSLGTYAWGRVFDQPKVSHTGMDLVRAQLITEMLVQSLKYATQRPRPDHSDNLSFPSGHAAVTFAGATVIERHLGWKKAALAYGIASYVSASRLHDNVHNLSDVVFGAAVGVIGGRTVTVHGRQTWTMTPAAVPHGVAVLIVHTPRDNRPDASP